MFRIKSPDTDVLDLTAYYVPKMANTVNMWNEAGTITAQQKTADLDLFFL